MEAIIFAWLDKLLRLDRLLELTGWVGENL